MRYSTVLVVVALAVVLAACGTATPPASAPSPAASGSGALMVTGAVDKPQSLSQEALKGLGVVKIKAEHPKLGNQEYEGVRLKAILDLAKPKEGTTKLTLLCGDGYTTDATLEEVRQCSDCLLAFNGSKLDAAMPGLRSGRWAKDVVRIEVK